MTDNEIELEIERGLPELERQCRKLSAECERLIDMRLKMAMQLSDFADRKNYAIISQKAEIERLEAKSKQKNPYEKYGNCVAIGDSLVFTHTLDDYDKLIKDIETEAIKEFAERLKNKIWCHPDCNRYRIITTDDIDDLAREMTEEK